MVIVLMGVSGSGKTTVGTLLARDLGWEFRDADELHSPENKGKLTAGIPLTDADRAPWLESIRQLIGRYLERDLSAVIACSALKQSYREKISVDPAKVRFVYLRGTEQLIATRIAHRRHFMNKGLLHSQFQTLEEPRDALAVDVSDTPQAIAAHIRKRLGI